MSDTWSGMFGMFVGFVIGSGVFLAISIMFDSFEIREFKHNAIDHGYAEYNNISGEWQWKDKTEQ